MNHRQRTGLVSPAKKDRLQTGGVFWAMLGMAVSENVVHPQNGM